MNERDALILDRKMREKRHNVLERELKRIARHKGKLVDTDVWVAGVLQRAQTKVITLFDGNRERRLINTPNPP